MPHPAALPIDELLKECEWSRSRSRGPGGQRRNKVETQVLIEHTPTGISAQAGEDRSAEVNRRRAIKRLRVRLAIEHREPLGLFKYRPPEFLARRIRDGKISLSPRHDEFPAALAELLDLIYELRGEVADAAFRLEATNSQVLKVLRHEPEALEQVNEWRRARGKRALK
ncbi:MAG: peptide chain release factor family protein [Phycisphaerales bacterium]